MTQEKTRLYANQVEQKTNRMVELARDLSEKALRRKPSSDAWSVMEVLCHVEEMLDYWRLELERVMQNKGGEWGRTLQHEGRLAAVTKADERTLKDVMEGLRAAAARSKESLFKLHDADLDIQAPHRIPKFGTKSMTFLVDHLIIEHLDSHIRQIERTLG